MNVHRPDELAYHGIPTFAKRELVLDTADFDGVDIAIIGAPIDEYVTYRPGARFGPRAIRQADYLSGPAFPGVHTGVDPFEVLKVVDHGDVVPTPGYPDESHAALKEMVKGVCAAGAIPIILGGDHSIAHPDVAGVAEHHRPEALGVVHFDSHADDAWEGGYKNHGTPFRFLVMEESIKGSDVVQVGLRGYWPPPSDFEWAQEQGFRWHLMQEIYERGIEPVTDDIVLEMARVPHVFLSIDVDVADPAFAPGTGTPEPGGLQSRELLSCVRRLARDLPIAGIEVVEVSPPYDSADITALLAHRIVMESLSGIALRRLGKTEQPV